ncbi:tumor necrosis factor receptor superfamily member 27 isoform X1 [Hypomesus transpacificus]|uniref:tumor necrosis factor receptor superfamily member 27 isoform X1 n=1 Tax=Hypomesus transpacificus TaxID=137520 RepID=UPI001F0762AA|nr:tumor necrosis factor receptor superfamily member 27 isoform X1 [Hypomesus transpacificus]
MDCTENQYSLNEECHPCLQCEPGLELSEDCGYGNGQSAHCTPCSLKTYKEDWGHHNCRFCQSCKRLNRQEKSSCTSRRNAVCGKCLPGFYSKIRIDGLQDLECMPCVSSSSSGQQCRRSRGVDVEKESVSGILPQDNAPADTVSVVLVTMAITLSVVLLIYFRQTILRKFYKGCLAFKSKSQIDMESAACRVNRVTLNPNQEEQIPGPCGVFTAADYGTQGDELDLPESVTITPQHPPQGCSQTPDVQPLAPDVTDGYCSSGFESLTSSEQPFNSQELTMATLALLTRQPSDIQEVTVATPAPLEGCARRSPCPPSQTAQGHCASQLQDNYQHVPVECTEMDIHRVVSSSLDLLHCQTEQRCSSGRLGARAVSGGLDDPNNSNTVREQSWSPSARVKEPLDSCFRIPQHRGCCNSPGYSNRMTETLKV